MEPLKKAGRFLCSMKCAVGLLLILAAACTMGSLIPQGEAAGYYTQGYPQAAGAILMLGLDDVFHCWWFVALTLFLCVNLLFCNIIHFPSLVRKSRYGFSWERCLKGWDGTALGQTDGEPGKLFAKMGFKKIEKRQTEDGAQVWYGARHKAGIWGPWLCHLGMLTVIAGFGLGQLCQEQYTVYGVPGQTKPVGDTGYELTIDSFDVKLRDDATVEQYTTALTVGMESGGTGAYMSGETSVNRPLSLFGMKFYQNSTGWAAEAEVRKAGEVIQETLLCAGEYAPVEDREGLAVMLNAFYPDYGEDAAGMPRTLSPALRNPAYLYTLYYHDQILGMNVLKNGEKITVDSYEIRFVTPRQYTLIQIKRDPFGWLAAVGGVMVLASLLLAFYIRPEEMWAVRAGDGTWAVSGRSRKSGAMFLESISAACKKMAEEEAGEPAGEERGDGRL